MKKIHFSFKQNYQLFAFFSACIIQQFIFKYIQKYPESVLHLSHHFCPKYVIVYFLQKFLCVISYFFVTICVT